MSATISGAGDGKSAVEKGKRASHHTRIVMDFDLKTSKLRDQEVVDKHLASYGFRLNPGIKIEFCPLTVDVFSTPPKGKCVYMRPQVLALGLRLPMTKFIHSVLFIKLPLSVISGGLTHGTRIRSPL